MVELINLGNPMRLIPNKSDSDAANRAFAGEVMVLNKLGRSFKLTGATANSICRSFKAERIS